MVRRFAVAVGLGGGALLGGAAGRDCPHHAHDQESGGDTNRARCNAKQVVATATTACLLRNHDDCRIRFRTENRLLQVKVPQNCLKACAEVAIRIATRLTR